MMPADLLSERDRLDLRDAPFDLDRDLAGLGVCR